MYKEFIFKTDVRNLWVRQVIYTRQLIISSINDIQSQDIPYIIQRIAKNQEEIGSIFKPYYEERISSDIIYFLKEYADIFNQFIIANIKGDLTYSISQKTCLYMNAIQTAKYIHDINPKINKIIIRDMLFDHLDFTERELLARLRKDYVADIIFFDSVYDQILQLADVLSEGIIRHKKEMFRDDYKESEESKNYKESEYKESKEPKESEDKESEDKESEDKESKEFKKLDKKSK